MMELCNLWQTALTFCFSFYIGKGGDSKIAVAACGLVLITHYLAEDFLFLL